MEIGLSDEYVTKFMPEDLYQKSRKWAELIAQKGDNNTRATMEALVFQNGKGEWEVQFIECNRRPQVVDMQSSEWLGCVGCVVCRGIKDELIGYGVGCLKKTHFVVLFLFPPRFWPPVPTGLSVSCL